MWCLLELVMMEEELQFLREEVRSQTSSVHRLQQALFDQKVRSNTALLALRSHLSRSCRRHRHLQRQNQQRLADTLSQLLLLEGRIRQEQRQVLQLLHDKDDVIQRQKAALTDLGAQNDKLMALLTQVPGYSLRADLAQMGDGEVGLEEREPQVVMRHKDKDSRHKVHFRSSLKDTLKRHKSSQELHRPRSMETLLDARHCNSQEYLSDGGLLPSSTNRKRHDSDNAHNDSKGDQGEKPSEAAKGQGSSKVQEGSKGREGSKREKGKKSRQKDRQEKCQSLVEQSSRLLGLPEVPSDRERERDGFSLSVPLFRSGRTHSPSRPKRDHSPCPAPNPHSQDSLNSDDEETAHLSHNDRQYGELAKASSMPLTLTLGSEVSAVEGSSQTPRPRSLPWEELGLHEDPLSMEAAGVSGVSMNPSPTTLVPPGHPDPLTCSNAAGAPSDSSPFQSLKNVFKRRSTKQRSKKRPVSMGQAPSQEFHSALKEHFKKCTVIRMIPRTEKTSDHENGKEQETYEHVSGELSCCFLQSAAVNLNRGKWTQTYQFMRKQHPGNKTFSCTVIRMIPRRQTMKMGRSRTQITCHWRTLLLFPPVSSSEPEQMEMDTDL
ncbi:uncharacterized protein LOC143289813 isoform X2 [Babylonia areolata]|uniref:uncharacterized protein LOC143289813 isoform X2 n=1 Tax=Babylonia areolata TaxID=304850 RepID=UPI003FD15603